MASLEILDELPPIWFQFNRHQTIELLRKLLPLLTHRLRARREAIHQHALLLSALTNLGLILSQVRVPVLSHVSPSDLDMHLTKTCQVLDDILHGRLPIVSEELRRDAEADLTTDLVLGDIENGIDTIDALAKSLERCDRRKQTGASIKRYDSRRSTERKCHDHWQILFGHMSRSLPQMDPSCAMGHSAKVHLKHIYSGDPNMSLLVSNCLAEEWYPIYCEKKESSRGSQDQIRPCSYFGRGRYPRRTVNLHFNESEFWRAQSNTGPVITEQEFRASRSLETILSRRIGRAIRKLLQCALAQSLYYLCDSPWLTECWDIEDLTFGRSEDRIHPGIVAELYASTPRFGHLTGITPNAPPTAQFMIRFGLILLQIEFKEILDADEAFTTPLDKIRNDDTLDEYDLEDEFFGIIEHEALKYDIDDQFREVLKACCQYSVPEGDVGTTRIGDSPRHYIYKRIVIPLKQALFENFADHALNIPTLPGETPERAEFVTTDMIDMQMSTTSLDISGAHTLPSSTDLRAGQAGTGDVVVLVNQNTEAGPSNALSSIDDSRSSQPVANSGRVFLQRPSATSSEAWLSRVEIITNKMQLSKKERESTGCGQRIKVAVLDTGIEPEHPMSGSVHYKDFVDPNEKCTKDETSHGTTSLDLVLKMYQDAELYIARVFETNDAHGDLEAVQMAMAIDWAIECKVDIISISAGFQDDNSDLRNAVRRAHNADILIFAAASNWGNLESAVAYPARMRDQVFCIFSSNGANKATTDRNPEPRKKADNFAFLGEDIDAQRPGSLPISGTSMATALAAGFAARMLDFSLHSDSQVAGIDATKFHTKSGMTAVLNTISSHSGEFQCITPWLLCKYADTQARELARGLMQKVLKEALEETD